MRHEQVHEDDIWLVESSGLDGFYAVLGLAANVPVFAGHQCAQGLPHFSVVIDDEKANRFHGMTRHRRELQLCLIGWGAIDMSLRLDRWRDVPEMPASSAPKPSQTAFRCDCEDALCISRIALWARRNPTTFWATRFAVGRGDEFRLSPHRP